MKGEYSYCIYNDEFFCTLKETQLNSLGMCEEYIIVSIADKDLKTIKEKQLEDIENRLIKGCCIKKVDKRNQNFGTLPQTPQAF